MAVSASALELRDTTPSMRWAYDLHETGRGVVIDVHDLDVTFGESEHGVVIELTGPVAWPDLGEPRLPKIVLVFTVSDDAAYEVDWSVSSFEDHEVSLLAPETSRADMKPLPTQAIYTRDAYRPELMAKLEEARGGDIRYLRVEISPLQYNAATGMLRTHRGLKIALSRGRDELGGRSSATPRSQRDQTNLPVSQSSTHQISEQYADE